MRVRKAFHHDFIRKRKNVKMKNLRKSEKKEEKEYTKQKYIKNK